MLEKDLACYVVDCARLYKWKHYHTFDSRRSPEGFPDLCLVRPPRIVFAELKSEHGRLTPAQREWVRELGECGLEVHLWRPADIDNGIILEVLR